jgi:hypothetical protein
MTLRQCGKVLCIKGHHQEVEKIVSKKGGDICNSTKRINYGLVM